MNDAPDGDRGHDRSGPYQRPQPQELCEGGSVPRSSSSERKTLTENATRRNQEFKAAYTVDTARKPTQTQASESASKHREESEGCSKPIKIAKRPATLWCASGGGPAASAAGRAPATGGSQTSGGAVAVRFAPEADVCGALGCRRSRQLVAVGLEGDRRVLCLAHARRWVR